jgi:predicted protein tyrosine phosphatase
MTVIVAPFRDVASLLALRNPCRVLSLISPDAEAPTFGQVARQDHLILRFNDIAEPRAGLVPASADTVAAILDFARNWDGTAPFLIHCWAGVSRSTAAAFILACSYGRAGEEAAAAQTLRQVAPFATPNPLLVKLADELLHRDGKMVEAVAAIGRGAETSYGVAFDYPVLSQVRQS